MSFPVQRKLIIGIDSGTTRSCIASYVQRSLVKTTNPDIEVFCDYDNSKDKEDMSTDLYYSSTDALPVTGSKVDTKLKKGKQDGFSINRMFRLWKLMFHNQKDSSTIEIQEKIRQQLNDLGKTQQDLLHDWVEITYRHIIWDDPAAGTSAKFRDTIPDFDKLNIEIVVPVPPGRSVIAHSQVINAFTQGPIKSHQVFLVSEPEALFRAWVHREQKSVDWQVGQRFLVLDAGGGTGCLVRFRLTKLEPLEFEQEFESESITCGAETISNEFDRLADAKIDKHLPDRELLIGQSRRKFEEIKKAFGSTNQKEWSLNRGDGQKLHFGEKELAACFQPCAAKLFCGIKRQIALGPLDYLLSGGGLCENGFIRKLIRKEFGGQMIVQNMTHRKDHVAKGAVLTRLDGGFVVKRRPVKYSKGLGTLREVTAAIRRLEIYPDLDIEVETSGPDKGKEWFYAVDWLARQGQIANASYELESEASYQGARNRFFRLDVPFEDLKFIDTIYSVDVDPGTDEFAFFTKDNGGLIDQHGVKLPKPKFQMSILWKPKEMGVSISGLATKSAKNQPTMRILRYSFQMEMSDVGTRYRIKAWSLRNKIISSATPVFSERHHDEASFDRGEISRGLTKSCSLGHGLEKFTVPTGASTSFDETRASPPRARNRVADEMDLLVPISFNADSMTAIRQEVPPPYAPLTPTMFGMIDARSKKVTQAPQTNLGFVPAGRPSDRSVTHPSQPVASRRRTGGCYNCSLRKQHCSGEEPRCMICTNLGFAAECTFVEPGWWNANGKKRQLEIQKELIEVHKRQKRDSASKTASPRPRRRAAQNMNYQDLSLGQSSQLRPSIENSDSSVPSSQNFSGSSQDLYSATPPPRRANNAESITVSTTTFQQQSPAAGVPSQRLVNLDPQALNGLQNHGRIPRRPRSPTARSV